MKRHAYVAVGKTCIKKMMFYRFNIFMQAIYSVVFICVMYLMWRILFIGKTTINGYTFSNMLIYYVLVNLFSRLNDSRTIASEFMEEIKEGTFTKYIVRPINVFRYYSSLCISKIIYNLVIYCIPTTILMFFIGLNYGVNINLQYIPFVLVIYVMGTFFMIQLDFFIIMNSFWFTEAGSFFIFLSNIQEFLTGVLIPLSFFPEPIQRVFSYLPFYYLYYYPIDILINGPTDLIKSIIVLFIWNVVFGLLIYFVYRKAIQSYSGVGI